MYVYTIYTYNSRLSPASGINFCLIPCTFLRISMLEVFVRMNIQRDFEIFEGIN
jgi:hypothetical protein